MLAFFISNIFLSFSSWTSKVTCHFSCTLILMHRRICVWFPHCIVKKQNWFLFVSWDAFRERRKAGISCLGILLNILGWLWWYPLPVFQAEFHLSLGYKRSIRIWFIFCHFNSYTTITVVIEYHWWAELEIGPIDFRYIPDHRKAIFDHRQHIGQRRY